MLATAARRFGIFAGIILAALALYLISLQQAVWDSGNVALPPCVASRVTEYASLEVILAECPEYKVWRDTIDADTIFGNNHQTDARETREDAKSAKYWQHGTAAGALLTHISRTPDLRYDLERTVQDLHLPWPDCDGSTSGNDLLCLLLYEFLAHIDCGAGKSMDPIPRAEAWRLHHSLPGILKALHAIGLDPAGHFGNVEFALHEHFSRMLEHAGTAGDIGEVLRLATAVNQLPELTASARQRDIQRMFHQGLKDMRMTRARLVSAAPDPFWFFMEPDDRTGRFSSWWNGMRFLPNRSYAAMSPAMVECLAGVDRRTHPPAFKFNRSLLPWQHPNLLAPNAGGPACMENHILSWEQQIDQAFAQADRTRASLMFLRTVAAIAAHATEHNHQWVATIELLIPDYLPAVPIHPRTGTSPQWNPQSGDLTWQLSGSHSDQAPDPADPMRVVNIPRILKAN